MIPTIARPEELSRDLATRAHSGTSFVPDKRASQEQQAFADDVNGFHAELVQLATNDDQRRIVAEEIGRYKANYLKHRRAYLASRSNVMSAMITGPANFPTARNQKRGQWADNKLQAFLDWRKKARHAIIGKIQDARTPAEAEAAEWEFLRRGIGRSLDAIREIDTVGAPYTRSAFVNSIVGKVKRLAVSGEVGLVDRSIDLVQEYNNTHKKPAISTRHKFWTFPALAREQEQKHDAATDKPAEAIAAGNGASVVANHAADRVQILFDAKPDDATRRRLKSSGWRWSPTEGAWQRKLTRNALDAAKSFVEGGAA